MISVYGEHEAPLEYLTSAQSGEFPHAVAVPDRDRRFARPSSGAELWSVGPADSARGGIRSLASDSGRHCYWNDRVNGVQDAPLT